MHRIKHIAITAEDPFATAALFKQAFGLEELSRGDSEIAREVYLTDGHINLAIVCWKRTAENPNPYPEGYGLDHFGFQVDDLEVAEARARSAGATPSRRRRSTSRRMGGRIFFEKKLQLAGVKFDLSGEGWATTRAEAPSPPEEQAVCSLDPVNLMDGVTATSRQRVPVSLRNGETA